MFPPAFQKLLPLSSTVWPSLRALIERMFAPGAGSGSITHTYPSMAGTARSMVRSVSVSGRVTATPCGTWILSRSPDHRLMR